MTKVQTYAVIKFIHYYTTVQLQIAASNAAFSDIIESKEKVHYSSKGLCAVTTATIILNLIQVALLMVALLMEDRMVKEKMEEKVKEEEEEMVQEMEEKEETMLMDQVRNHLKV